MKINKRVVPNKGELVGKTFLKLINEQLVYQELQSSDLLGSPLRGYASPSGEAKEILVYQDPKKFQGGDAAAAAADGSTDGHEG